jgi:hypothetical protein
VRGETMLEVGDRKHGGWQGRPLGFGNGMASKLSAMASADRRQILADWWLVKGNDAAAAPPSGTAAPGRLSGAREDLDPDERGVDAPGVLEDRVAGRPLYGEHEQVNQGRECSAWSSCAAPRGLRSQCFPEKIGRSKKAQYRCSLILALQQVFLSDTGSNLARPRTTSAPVPVEFDASHAPKGPGEHFLAGVDGRRRRRHEVPGLGLGIEGLQECLEVSHGVVDVGHVPVGVDDLVQLDDELGRREDRLLRPDEQGERLVESVQ